MITFTKIDSSNYVVYSSQGIDDLISDYKITGIHKGIFSKWLQKDLLYPAMINLEKELLGFKQEQNTKRNRQ